MVSGSSQNTSTRAEVFPSFAGFSQPLLDGSPRKNAAPPISKPATDPTLHKTVAPRACLNHSTAAGVSATASITDRMGSWAVIFRYSPYYGLFLFWLVNLLTASS